MFLHNLYYSLKTLFKNKVLIFWTFAFPLILGTFFNMAFSNIEKSEQLDIIDIAIVQNENFTNSDIYKETFKTLSDGEDALFSIRYCDEEEASEYLKNGDVIGYLVLEDEPRLVFVKNGIDETILERVTKSIEEGKAMYERAVEEKFKAFQEERDPVDLQLLQAQVLNEVKEAISSAKADIIDTSSENLSYTMIEFYTLIAMTCLYGGILGMSVTNNNLANMSKKGMRVATSPVPKRVLIFCGALSGYIVQLIGLALLFIYTIFVLKVDYGVHMKEIVFLSLAGSLSGLSLGIMVSALLKVKEDTKMGIIIAITMMGSFLAGMMGITMKYIVDVNYPIINKINPVSMITDGLYSLYYYGVGTRYYTDLISLIAFSSLMIGISIWSLKRGRYDSI